MKKTIKVWINSCDNFDNNFKNASIHWSAAEAAKFTEADDITFHAELIIEVPEKRIYISESELREAIEDSPYLTRTQFTNEILAKLIEREGDQ